MHAYFVQRYGDSNQLTAGRAPNRPWASTTCSSRSRRRASTRSTCASTTATSNDSCVQDAVRPRHRHGRHDDGSRRAGAALRRRRPSVCAPTNRAHRCHRCSSTAAARYSNRRWRAQRAASRSDAARSRAATPDEVLGFAVTLAVAEVSTDAAALRARAPSMSPSDGAELNGDPLEAPRPIVTRLARRPLCLPRAAPVEQSEVRRRHARAPRTRAPRAHGGERRTPVCAAAAVLRRPLDTGELTADGPVGALLVRPVQAAVSAPG